ncbi:hypothetical protein ACN27F_19850 [Solwaraspora sp. WMMB335]|uniref:hypothetical protein n=1 Tax=Solwaraspora sp. WMMB335 TaxID=3404118 RepID=UPI003B955816
MRRRIVTRCGTLVLIAHCAVVFAGAAAAAPADGTIPPRNVPTETGKYYVVGPPVDGQREYLFAIAVKTLGDGGRYREIFALNEGRPQPDGRQMVDATTVEPGWILILPADAAGPAVRTGALPAPAGSTAAADGLGTPAGGSDGWLGTGLRAALLVLAVLLVVWAWVALAVRRRPRPVGEPEPVAEPEPVGEPASRRRATADGRVADPVMTARRLAAPTPDLGTTVLLPPSPPNSFDMLITELNCGGRPGWVRLVGARPTRWGSAYGWLPADRPPPPSIAALILGERDGLRLWVDLSRAPDALTIVGDPTSARQHAVALVAQLGRNTDVVVTGDALGGDVPDVARWVPAVADLDTDRSTARTLVVVCSAEDAPALRERSRELLRSDGRRPVPVIVGPAPAARWSIRMGAAGSGAHGDPGRARHDQPWPSPATRH